MAAVVADYGALSNHKYLLRIRRGSGWVLLNSHRILPSRGTISGTAPKRQQPKTRRNRCRCSKYFFVSRKSWLFMGTLASLGN